MGGSFSYILRFAALLAGTWALLWHPSQAWVERDYANGMYPPWQHLMHAIAQPLPWSLGDFVGVFALGLLIWRVLVALQKCPRSRRRRALVLLLDLLAIAGLFAFWFEASWGWNYDRAPIETRLAFDPSRVNERAVNALRVRSIAEINRLARGAHALAARPMNETTLRVAWTPAVVQGGDTWIPVPDSPKPTVADPFMLATGTSGFINPFTLNSQLASDLLWFERPFSLAHEWSHVAAYAREDEANYLAIITCIRSPDLADQYSGWLELFLYLPPLPDYPRRMFSPLVWSDFAAIRRRNARRINLTLAHWSWSTYNTYLKSNHVSSGIENYNEVTRLILGIPLQRDGLPMRRSR